MSPHLPPQDEEKFVTTRRILMEESSLPWGLGGTILDGGWFCVDHSKVRLRLASDHRPQNATEGTLRWPDLPSGPAMIHLKLEPWETVRGSGEDLECWYYCHKESRYAKNAAGRRVRGEQFTKFGALPGKSYRFCLSVVVMGDTNGLAPLRKATRLSYIAGAA